MVHFKKIVKKFCPPIIKEMIVNRRNKFGYFGDFASWEDAKNASEGYDKKIILDKVEESTRKVKTGRAVYERDSVVFDKVEYSWPLIACLLWIGAKENKLHLIDFGGSLGSTYFQSVFFLKHLREIKWSIVEQEHFVKVGQTYFENEHVRFYRDLDVCLQENIVETIIFSSVLQYLENPYHMLQRVKDQKFRFIIIDRTLFLSNDTNDTSDRITIQKVPPHIYNASYPCRFFDENKFLNFFIPEYKLISDFDALGGMVDEHGIKGKNKGYLFELI